MALILSGVDKPSDLRQTIIDRCKPTSTEKFRTWDLTTGKFKNDPKTYPAITHTGEGGQWKEKVVFIIQEQDNGLRFAAVDGTAKGYDEAYPYVHGRLLELVAAHFGGQFKQATYKDQREK